MQIPKSTGRVCQCSHASFLEYCSILHGGASCCQDHCSRRLMEQVRRQQLPVLHPSCRQTLCVLWKERVYSSTKNYDVWWNRFTGVEPNKATMTSLVVTWRRIDMKSALVWTKSRDIDIKETAEGHRGTESNGALFQRIPDTLTFRGGIPHTSCQASECQITTWNTQARRRRKNGKNSSRN